MSAFPLYSLALLTPLFQLPGSTTYKMTVATSTPQTVQVVIRPGQTITTLGGIEITAPKVWDKKASSTTLTVSRLPVKRLPKPLPAGLTEVSATYAVQATPPVFTADQGRFLIRFSLKDVNLNMAQLYLLTTVMVEGDSSNTRMIDWRYDFTALKTNHSITFKVTGFSDDVPLVFTVLTPVQPIPPPSP